MLYNIVLVSVTYHCESAIGIHMSHSSGASLPPHLMSWMILKPGIQSEVSQEEKKKDHILMHIYEI